MFYKCCSILVFYVVRLCCSGFVGGFFCDYHVLPNFKLCCPPPPAGSDKVKLPQWVSFQLENEINSFSFIVLIWFVYVFLFKIGRKFTFVLPKWAVTSYSKTAVALFGRLFDAFSEQRVKVQNLKISFSFIRCSLTCCQILL